MHCCGDREAAACDMLMTSAVAMFFSWSGATDLSDRSLSSKATLCPTTRPQMTCSLDESAHPTLLRFLFLLRCGIVDLDSTPRTKSPQNLVAPRYDFVAFLQATRNFDVSRASNSGHNLHKLGFFITYY